MRLKGFALGLAFALAAVFDFPPIVQPAFAQTGICLVPPAGVSLRRTRYVNCPAQDGAGYAAQGIRVAPSVVAGQVLTTDGLGGVAPADPTGGGGGLAAVSSDSTLQGLGTAADVLGLTDAEVNRLDSVPGLLAETADLSIDVISQSLDGRDRPRARRLRQPRIWQHADGRPGGGAHLPHHTGRDECGLAPPVGGHAGSRYRRPPGCSDPAAGRVGNGPLHRRLARDRFGWRLHLRLFAPPPFFRLHRSFPERGHAHDDAFPGRV